MPIFPPQGGGEGATAWDLLGVWYASPSGGDNRDGKSPATSKFTVSAAMQACDDDGGGTVIFDDGTHLNSVAGAGMWIRGTYDIGIGGPGWTTIHHPLRIIVNGSLAGPFSFSRGTGVVTGVQIGPALAVAGLNSTFEIDGYYTGSGEGFPCYRLGLSSKPAAWSALTTYAEGEYALSVSDNVAYISLGSGNINHVPASSPSDWRPVRARAADGLIPTLTSLVRHRNCCFVKSGLDAGPAIDIGAGFWYWFDQVSWSCSPGPLADGPYDEFKNAGVRVWMDAAYGGGYTYLTNFTDCRSSGGGIFVQGGHEINCETIVGENMFMPIVHGLSATTKNSGQFSPRGRYTDVTIADSALYVTDHLLNEGIMQWIGSGCSTVGGNGNILSTTVAQQAQSGRGQVGFQQSFLTADLDHGRRMFSPRPARYKNIAVPLAWATGTPTTGPSGSSNAIISGGPYGIYNTENGWERLGIGDYLFWGLWVNYPTLPDFAGCSLAAGVTSATIYTGSPGCQGGTGETVIGAGGLFAFAKAYPLAPKQWFWLSGWFRYVARGSNATTLAVTIGPDQTVILADPWCVRVPVGDMGDSEAGEFAITSAHTPNAAPAGDPFSGTPLAPDVGMVGMTAGQKLSFFDATLGVFKYLDIDNGTVRIT